MKKRNFLIAMAGISLALGMMVIGCDQDGGGSNPGTLTVNNCPAITSLSIYNPPKAPTTESEFDTALNSIVATTMSSKSPFQLMPITNPAEKFTHTGNFMVVILTGGTVYFKANVSFTNGSATINFSDMAPSSSLSSGMGMAEKLDFSLVLTGVTAGSMYTAVVYDREAGTPLASAAGKAGEGGSISLTFSLVSGEYLVKVAEGTGGSKTIKSYSYVVFAEGRSTVELAWDEVEPVADEDEPKTGNSTSLAGTTWVLQSGGYTLYRLTFNGSTATMVSGSVTFFSNAPYTYSGSRVEITVKGGNFTATVQGNTISIMGLTLTKMSGGTYVGATDEDEPKAEKPVEEPVADEPEAEKPVADEPEAEKPEVVVGEPEVAEPEADEPEAEKPVVVDAEI
jgi:hypothetical protein